MSKKTVTIDLLTYELMEKQIHDLRAMQICFKFWLDDIENNKKTINDVKIIFRNFKQQDENKYLEYMRRRRIELEKESKNEENPS